MKKAYKYIFLALALCSQLAASAFSSNKYASTSRLASGKWVKIALTKSGMYQITYDQLAEMGFSDPSKVKVYGHGGSLMSELLDGNAIDDLQQVAIGRSNNKIYFYANGLVKMTLNTNKKMPAYTRTINHYANKAYYFLTENDESASEIKYYSTPSAGGIYYRKTSLDYTYHESELTNLASAGRELFGESIIPASEGKPVQFDYTLNTPAEDSTITVQCAIGAIPTAETSISCKLNSDSVPFSSRQATINTLAGFDIYKTISPVAAITPLNASSSGKLSISIAEPANLSKAYLDYFILTYFHDNSMNGSQMRLGFNDLSVYDEITILDGDKNIQVWNITDSNNPTRMRLTAKEEYDEDLEENITVQDFYYGSNGNGEFIAFRPDGLLYEIDSYETVKNQNLHGEATPDFVIICPRNLHQQAERLAQLHRDKDGMQVLVADQEDIFNEFSSGTPDATAYRLMLKMFYDRDPQKLKYLLMFGGGYFDNRQILRNKGDNFLLTYQSVIGYNNSLTYVSDDYFALLSDNSGSSITSDQLCLGVGRLPVITEEEARDIVDKISSYIDNTDYSNWRNKMIIMDEFGDDNIHTFQATNLENLVATTTAKDLDIKRLHVAAYTLVESNANPVYAKGNKNTYAAKLQLSDFLNEGALYMTYMGHGGPTSLSKKYVWLTIDVKNTPLTRLPIMSIAACDIANYDSNTRGIGEYMIITPGHGCIALLTSTRTVEATENDQINRDFIKALFTTKSDGSTRTLGEAYVTAKSAYGTLPSRNKMCYTLFADPALKPNYPKSYIKANTLNGIEANTPTVLKPMTKVNIEASVCTADGNVDTAFNGEATISLYDVQEPYKEVEDAGVTLQAYHNRPLLSETMAKVENGKFTASLLVPKTCTANGNNGLIKFYARSNDNKTLENGSISNISFAEYNEDDETTIIDNQAPVIEKMYINDETSFANDLNVAPDFTLHAQITDDVALCNQSQTIGKQISLVLDGSEYYNGVRGFTRYANDGASMTINMPLVGISEGSHNLKITVYDAAGNSASKTITFIVVPSQVEATLTASDSPAKDKVTFSFTHKFASTPTLKIFVTNEKNEVVWSKATADDTCEWDLTDNNGQRLPAGVYQYYGTAIANSQSAGTKISQLIILGE